MGYPYPRDEYITKEFATSNYLATLEKAIKIAVDAHAGQTDKCGLPYILHPLYVMDRVDTVKEKIMMIILRKYVIMR